MPSVGFRTVSSFVISRHGWKLLRRRPQLPLMIRAPSQGRRMGRPYPILASTASPRATISLSTSLTWMISARDHARRSPVFIFRGRRPHTRTTGKAMRATVMAHLKNSPCRRTRHQRLLQFSRVRCIFRWYVVLTERTDSLTRRNRNLLNARR